MTISQHQAADFLLIQEPDSLVLQFPGGKKPFSVDFLKGSFGQRLKRASGSKEPIAKAVGLKRGTAIRILDGTAGWGSDAMLLAVLGAHVTALERSPIVLALLQDGLVRAQAVYPRVDIKAIQADTLMYLDDLQTIPDVIYLDPMFPEREDSALVKKPMQLLQTLLGEAEDRDGDAEELVEKALGWLKKGVKRVVDKRPIKAKPLLRAPHHHIEAGIIRFDVYLPYIPSIHRKNK